MYVCSCNPFSDKDVKAHLETLDSTTSIKSAYAACSGGEKMNCGSCAKVMRDMVDEHNNTVIIGDLSTQMEDARKNAGQTTHEDELPKPPSTEPV